MTHLTRAPIDVAALHSVGAQDGALCVFVGVVRNENGGRPVLWRQRRTIPLLAAPTSHLRFDLLREAPRA